MCHSSFVALLAAVCISAHAGETTTIPLEVFASPAGVDAYPVEIGVPFPPGVLSDLSQIRLLDPDGTEMPCQVEELSRYADGTLRAALLIFISPVSKEKSSVYAIEFGDGVSRAAAPKAPVKAALPEGIELFVLEAGQKQPVAATQTDAVAEESGPIRSVVLVTGRFGAAADAHSYRARIHTYAGTGLVRLQHTVLSLDAKKPFDLAGWGIRINTGARKAWCGVAGAAKEVALAKGETLLQNDAFFGFEWGSMSFEEGAGKLRSMRTWPLGSLPGWRYRMNLTVGTEALGDARADGWLAADVPDGGLGVCVRDFWQQCPKAFSGSEKDITVWLHAPEGKPFVARAGTAKTHEILLDFSASGGDAESVAKLNAVFQDWPHARVSPEWVCATGIFGPLLPRSDPFTEHYNRLTDVFLAYMQQTDGRMPIISDPIWQMYGNADFGDFTRLISFCNVSEDQARDFFVEFLRGADREWARMAARAARHYGDIDVCHADTEESSTGLPWEVGRIADKRMGWPLQRKPQAAFAFKAESAEEFEAEMRKGEEIFAAIVAPRDLHQGRAGRGGYYYCHAGGAMPYYLIGGDRRAMEVLREQADRVLKMQGADRRKDPAYTFRLSVLMNAHEATGDPTYLEGAAQIMKEFLALWKTPVDERRDIAKLKAQVAAGKSPLQGWSLPGHGFLEIGFDRGGRWITARARRDLCAFRFLELNTPEANTGLDNEELQRMLVESMETAMRGTIAYCTPAYIAEWTMAANTGLWPEASRRIFEEKVLLWTSYAKRPEPEYRSMWSRETPSPIFKYKLPFLHYKWSPRKKTGVFVPFEPEEIAKTYVPGNALHPFVCHLNEFGIGSAMVGYPYFTAVWKEYHEKHLKPRMNAEGVLEFSITPFDERKEPAQ